MVTVLLRWPVRYCAFTDPGQVKKTRNTKVGAMDIEEAPDQPSRRIGSQKSHQIVAYCHILSLLVRGCHGAHISIALSRPRVEGKEFWVFSSDAPWTCRNREVMAISPRNPALRPLLCPCLQSVPHGKGMKVFALLLGEPDTSSTAQGGGGSFKNRKPIGEVGCCESRMAERIHWWTERWLKLCFLEWLQWLQWSPQPQLLDVVWRTAVVIVVVVVVSCGGVVAVMCN